MEEGTLQKVKTHVTSLPDLALFFANCIIQPLVQPQEGLLFRSLPKTHVKKKKNSVFFLPQRLNYNGDHPLIFTGLGECKEFLLVLRLTQPLTSIGKQGISKFVLHKRALSLKRLRFPYCPHQNTISQKYTNTIAHI